jgi:hypothetical protein
MNRSSSSVTPCGRRTTLVLTSALQETWNAAFVNPSISGSLILLATLTTQRTNAELSSGFLPTTSGTTPKVTSSAMIILLKRVREMKYGLTAFQ